MNQIELIFMTFGVMISIHIVSMVYRYFRCKEKLKDNYMMGILLFWVVIFLPVMGMDIIPTLKITPTMHTITNILIILCTLSRTFIAVVRMERARSGDDFMAGNGQMLFSIGMQGITYALYYLVDMIDMKLYIVISVLILAYFVGLWYYREKLEN
jgi:hypothetical protein